MKEREIMFKEFLDDKKGIMVVGDIHGYYTDFEPLLQYAINNNLLLVTLGDYVDVGPEAMKVLQAVLFAYHRKRCLPIIGNHDDSLYRQLIGNKVRSGKSRIPTLEDTELYPFVARRFINTFNKLFAWVTMSYGNKNLVFVHGSYVSGMTSSVRMGELDKKGSRRSSALYGETDGTKNARGYPNRTYDWVKSIPANTCVFVGHDIRSKSFPVVETNHTGGQAYFMDTGKKEGSLLSFAIIREDGSVTINKL